MEPPRERLPELRETILAPAVKSVRGRSASPLVGSTQMLLVAPSDRGMVSDWPFGDNLCHADHEVRPPREFACLSQHYSRGYLEAAPVQYATIARRIFTLSCTLRQAVSSTMRSRS